MSQVKESESVSGSVMSDSLEPHGLFESSGTVAHQAPLSMEFSRQEYWSGLPCPPPGDLPNPGIEPRSPVLQADSLQAKPPGKPRMLSPQHHVDRQAQPLQMDCDGYRTIA